MAERRRRPRDRASWEQRYTDGDLPWDNGMPDPHLRDVIQRHGIHPCRALEIGCGTGTNSIWLAQRGFEMSATDLSPTAISKAQAKAAAAGIDCRFLAADFLADPVSGNPFEFAYDRGCFHVFDEEDDRTRFASRVAEMLAPNALWHSLIGSTDGPPRETGPPRRSAEEVASAVEPHFEILELRSTHFDEGDHRDARAWVMVARRRERS